VTVIVLVLLLTVGVGWLRGGSLEQLATMQLRWAWLVAAATALTVVGAFAGPLGLPAPGTVYVVSIIAGAALVCAFVVLNRHLIGIPLVAVGFAMNAVVIAANGAMPVSERAAERAGVDLTALRAAEDAKHEFADRRTRLRPLADVIPVPLPGPLRRGSNVVSAGDVVLAAGLAQLVLNGMRGRQISPLRSSTRVSASTTRGSYS
jgi:hypothetical protein